MSENPVQSWIAVNAYMHDEYRETVVDVALRHLRSASEDLRTFAQRELSRAVTIPGFRTPYRAPVNVARQPVAREMRQATGVATAVRHFQRNNYPTLLPLDCQIQRISGQ